MSNCKYCKKPLVEGEGPFFAGIAHWKCHKAEYGDIAGMSFTELIEHAKKTINTITEEINKDGL